MRPIVLKLLRQESVTKQQWFDLFSCVSLQLVHVWSRDSLAPPTDWGVSFHSDVHAVCLWDDKGPAKIHQALKEDILDFIKQAQAVRAPS